MRKRIVQIITITIILFSLTVIMVLLQDDERARMQLAWVHAIVVFSTALILEAFALVFINKKSYFILAFELVAILVLLIAYELIIPRLSLILLLLLFASMTFKIIRISASKKNCNESLKVPEITDNEI